jgi:hypothetical protein
MKSSDDGFISPLQSDRFVMVIFTQGVALRALPWAILFHAFSVKNALLTVGLPPGSPHRVIFD